MRRGACPTLHAPMASGDGLLVRVNPPGARLSPEAARALAEAVERFANGVLELTQRGNLQVRGTVDPAAFADAMVAAGLAYPDPALEARRRVYGPPLLGEDESLHPGTAELVAALERAFLTDPRLDRLPPKFAVAVEGGGVFGDRARAATLVITAGIVAAGIVTAGIVSAGIVSAGIVSAGGGMRPGRAVAHRTVVGPVALPGGTHAAFELAPPFGQLDAGMLRGLAAVAERHGTTLGVTPWRSLLVAGVPLGAVAGIAGEVGPGWITDPGDARLLVTTCVGAPGCASASTPTRADAAWLRARAPVHLAGCAKGCAHPAAAGLTFVGRGGRYDLVRDGRAGDTPVLTGLTLDAVRELAA